MDNSGGRFIRGYELQTLLGAGGFGAVYQAYQSAVRRPVAMKIILPQYANHPEFIRRFEFEAQLVARLEHPHIVPLYDYWREPDSAYIVMRLLRGGSLRNLLEKGPLDLETVTRLLDHICTALNVAHRNGVIHRDIKPDNILLDDDQNAYLADFGIAKDLYHTEITREHDSREDEGITGSPHYLSPEQITSGPVSPRSDLYSLGIALFEALTGQQPFAGATTSQLIFRHLEDPMPDLAGLRPDLPEQINAVIQKATSKNADDRYQTALELLLAFKQAAAPGETRETSLGGAGEFGSALFPPMPETTTIQNPYKGLRAFEEADADDFFGRQGLIDHLLERLAETAGQSRFLAVVGPSGSGKSSVVKAGLLPQLRQGALPQSKSWFIAEMTPGTNPFKELEEALRRVAAKPLDQPEWMENERAVQQVIERALPTPTDELLLVIDQFEEIFTQTSDEKLRAQFLNSLFTAVTAPQSRVRIIITLRADFYDRPLMYPNFGGLVQERTEVVLPLTRQELEQAIQSPAEKSMLIFEGGVVFGLMDEVDQQPGTLPLLQYALTELFERRDGNWLTMAAYREIGGVLGALARRADEIYTGLSESQQRLTRQLFLRLIIPGEGAEDTRRRVFQTELLGLIPDPAAVQTLLDEFGRYRILSFDRDPVTRSPTVEIAHEALIRRWGQLREWINKSREDLRLHRRLALAVEEWRQAQRDKSFLASGSRLDQFMAWQDETDLTLTDNEREYLTTSRAERERLRAAEAARQAHEKALERRSRNRTRALLVVMVAATLLSSVLALNAYDQSQQAANARDQAESEAANAATQAAIADQNSLEAGSLALAANSQVALSNTDTDLAIALALAANAQTDAPPAVRQALIAAAYAPGTRRLFAGHTGWVNAVAFSPDGKQAVSGGADHTLILWDVEAGILLRQFGRDDKGHSDWVRAVVFSPDGKTILSASSDHSLILWDSSSGEIIRRFGANGEGHSDVVSSVALNEAGTQALSGSWDGTLILWDVQSGDVIQRLADVQGNPINSVALGKGGFTALSGQKDGRVVLWNLAAGTPLMTFSGHSDEALSVMFTPDGTGAVSASIDQNIILWSFETGEPRRFYRGHNARVYTLAFSPDGKFLASGSQDKEIRLWDFETAALVRTFKGPTDFVLSVMFAPDGQQLLSGSGDGAVRLWDIRNGAEFDQFDGLEQPLRSVAASPDGTMLVSGGLEGELIVWDTGPSGSTIRHRLTGHSAEVSAVAFSPDSRKVASASKDGTIGVWDVETGTSIQQLTGHTDMVLAVDFSPDGQRLASGSADNTVMLWEIDTGKPLWRGIKHTYWVLSVKFRPDGKAVMSASADQTLALWDVRDGSVIQTYNGHTGFVRAVAFNPSGDQAVSSSADNTLIVWDVEKGTVLRRIEGHTAEILSLAYSPTAELLVSGSRDAALILWDLDSGTALMRFDGHAEAIWSLTFAPDGNSFYSASQDRTLRRWAVRYALDDLRAWVQANRYVRELTCAEREQYRMPPYCPTPTPTPDPNQQSA